ncbi:putative ORFan [Tupanvirus deep ocean]|uniref:ORFan n=2 Tax=Tupanvirus TaxID=2094720 RepID=A0AC62A8G5_9VIRU|nr:putative ORFan [Tupanvirus deep ocean]QKU34071.1 putative ORFan [Tupanvirus deep ocean]
MKKEKEFYLKITVSNEFKNPNKLELKDILGLEFIPFYDGFGFDTQTKEKEFFFFDVPQSLICLVPERLNSYIGITYFIKQ